MYDFEDGVPFDPGYANNLVPFLQTLEQIEFELGALGKNFNQKKMKFKMLLPVAKKALYSTLGFWVGCMLWAKVIKHKFDGAKILGNNFLQLSKEDLKGFEYSEEFDATHNYINSYSKNVKYYLGTDEVLPNGLAQIIEDYKEFLLINEHFIKAKTTADLKLPNNYEKDCSMKDLDKTLEQIKKVIASKDLSKFLD